MLKLGWEKESNLCDESSDEAINALPYTPDMHLLNDVIKPWDELNSLLAKPFAYQPNLSDITRLANNIAVAIKHLVDEHNDGNVKEERKKTDTVSPANKLMSDIADSWKHAGKLKDSNRNNKMEVLSRFEFNEDGKFRFVRNKVLIEHAILGKMDFMVNARDAIRYWLSQIRPELNWLGFVLEGPVIFNKDAILFYDASQQLLMSSVRMETLKRAPNNKLYLADCPVIHFVMLDYHDDAFKQLGPPVIGYD